MSSQAKRNANRQNARRSTGPRTPEGKQRSSLNATRHGLTGQVNVRTEAEQKARDAHSQGFHEAWRPVGAPEAHLVQTMADKQWQIHRADAWLDSVYAVDQVDMAGEIDVEHPEVHAALTEGLITLKRAQQLDLIGRYTSRIQRDYRAALKDLMTLQAARKQQEQQQMQEAADIKQFCEMRKEAFVPAAFGFVSHTPEIDTYILRNQYLKQAATARKVNFNMHKYVAAGGR